ncbi:MAG: CHRD domain-containing protein [Acidimicrobiia bacterium]|nr:CHRD domain-containing protein [Acidimicrobiia bacterium]
MRRRRVAFAVVVGLVIFGLMAPGASAGKVDFRAPLSHAQETHSVNAPGAHGHAVFWVEGSTLHYRVSVKHLTGPATMAHIHAPGSRGTNAGVALWLCDSAAVPGPGATPACSTVTSGSLITGAVPVTAGQLAWLRDGVGYVNVHTVAHPAGEVRGQILRLGRK